jgi:hypothetical protein
MVIPRTCGVSSTPRTVVSITAVSGILDRLLARTNDNGGLCSRCRGASPGYANRFPQKRKRAQGERPGRRAPAARVHWSQARASQHWYSGSTEALCKGFLRLSRTRAGDEFAWPMSFGKLMVNRKPGRSRRRFALAWRKWRMPGPADRAARSFVNYSNRVGVAAARSPGGGV